MALHRIESHLDEPKNINKWIQQQINFLENSSKENFDLKKVQEQENEVIAILRKLTKLSCWTKYVAGIKQQIKIMGKNLKSNDINNITKMKIDALLNEINQWKKIKKSVIVHNELDKIYQPIVADFITSGSKNLSSYPRKDHVAKNLEQERKILEQKSQYRIFETKGDGDCGLHAILGKWSPDDKMVVCYDAVLKREKIIEALVKADEKSPLKNLVKKQIRNLVISNDENTQAIMKEFRDKYCQFNHELEKNKKDSWHKLELKLKSNQSMMQMIEESHDKKRENTLFLHKLQNALSKNEALKAKVLLLQEYTDYDKWTKKDPFKEEWITNELIQKYARFLGTPGKWLSAAELEIIAYVFNKKVFYHNGYCHPEIFNPEGNEPVHVRFNGRDHYEQMLLLPTAQYASSLTSHKIPQEAKTGLSNPVDEVQRITPGKIQEKEKMWVSDIKERESQPGYAEEQASLELEEDSNKEELFAPPISESKPDPQIKSLEHLLKEMKNHELNKEVDAENLRQQYEEIKKHEKQVAGWSQVEILAWANEMQVKLKDLSDFKKHLPEILAVINRANYIITYDGVKGHTLRDTQLLSVLCILEGKGKLAQIATGEGKSTIIAVLAVIKALQGERVDVITSSPVLAMRDAQEKRAFYKLFGFNCAHNHREEKDKSKSIPQEGMRTCYQAQIVYGSIHDFQFDYLDHSYRELKTRGDREFDHHMAVIIDEVDSMLVDNGGHIAKLSGPLPGMEHLLVLQFIIWEKLKECPDLKSALEIKARLKEEINQAIDRQTYNGKPLIIPTHFKNYAKGQVDQWIAHAFAAKYEYEKDRHYVLAKKDDEEVIVPVDYSNTGGLQNNTVWSDGLHQFIQIKEGLKVTAESLTTSFISNIAYIRLYQSNMMGLTGTLGSKEARELLQESYKIDYVFIPTYKEKQLKPEDVKKSIYRGEEEWYSAITADVMSECNKGKAGLVICETIQEAQQIKAILQEIGYSGKIREFLRDSDIDHISEQGKIKIDSGEIIISTNLSGRGTDIETSDSVEASGGLHVCVTFLPRNKRVEDQAVGRTARQGKKGTAHLIIEAEKTERLIEKALPPDAKVEKPLSVAKLVALQTRIEEYHIAYIRQHELKKLNREDVLFRQFSEFYRLLKKRFGEEFKKSENAPQPDLLLRAVEEQWGLWLKRESRGNPDFAQFKSLIEGNQGNLKEAAISASYCVLIGNNYSEAGEYNKAIEYYEKAIKADPDCYTAHAQLAIACIEGCKAVPAKIVNFLEFVPAGVVFVEPLQKIFNLPSKETQRDLLEKAYRHFVSCSSIINHYIDNLEYMCDQSITKIVQEDQDAEQLSPTCSHFNSKIALLQYQKASITQAIEVTNKVIKENILSCVAIQDNRPFTLDGLDESNIQLKKQINQSAIDDLSYIGFGNTFSVIKLDTIQKELATAAAIELAAGLAAIAGGIGLVVTPVAGLSEYIINLGVGKIVSGLSDLVLAILFPNEPFDKNAFLKEKAIETATDLFLGAVEAISKIPKVFQFTSRVVRKVKKILPTAMQMKVIAKRGEAVEKLLKARRTVNRLGKLEYAKDMAKRVARKIPVEVVKEIGSTVAIDKALDALIAVVLENQRKTEERLKEKLANLIHEEAIVSEGQLIEIEKRVKAICFTEIEKIVSKASGSVWNKIIEKVEFFSQDSIKGTLILKFASLYPQLIKTIVHDMLNDNNIKQIAKEINSGKYKNSSSKISRDKLIEELTRLFLNEINQHLAELIKNVLKKFIIDAALERAVNRLMRCFQKPKSSFIRPPVSHSSNKKPFNQRAPIVLSQPQSKKEIEPRPEVIKEPVASRWKEKGKNLEWFHSLPDHGTTTTMHPATQHKIDADKAYHHKQGLRRNSDPELFGHYDPLKSFGLDQSAIEKKRHDIHFTNVGKRSEGIYPQGVQKKPRPNPVTKNRFYFDGSFFHYDPKLRPNNQNANSVLRAVAKRPEVNAEFKRRVEAGEKKILSSMGLDMCHEHSAESIGTLLAGLSNHADAKGQANYRDHFATLSQERLPMKKDALMHCFDVFTDSKAARDKRVVALSDAMTMLNAAPNNLRPAHAPTNRSIGARDDLYIEKNEYHLKHGNFSASGVEATIPLSSARNRAPQTILQILLALKSRPPRKRQGPEGIEIQSSDIGLDPKQAYIPIRRHSNPDLSLKEASIKNPRRMSLS